MSDEREKWLDQDEPDLEDSEVEAHERLRADDGEVESSEEVEAHSRRLGPKHDLP